MPFQRGSLVNKDYSHRPNRVPWPPMIYIAVTLTALGLHLTWPMGLLPSMTGQWMRGSGLALAGLGIALDLAAMVALRRARTNILPHRGADHLVTHGVFARSRNPIYLGNTFLLAGLGLALASAWLFAGALVAAFLVDRLAIRREERHLAARFGQAFADYAERVPRWIRFRR